MLKRLENKLRMFKAAQTVLNKNSEVWQGRVAIVAIVNDFFSKLTEIEATRQITEADLKGATRDKNNLEADLLDKTYEISSAVYTLAVRTGNADLQQKVNHTETDLQLAREGELVAISESVASLVTANLSELSEYGIDENTVNELKELTASFKTKLSVPRAGIAERKAANEKLKVLFNDTGKLLDDQLDRMMVQLKSTNPDFYAAYGNSRMIVDFGIRHEKEDEQAA